jgi:diguanylate cyclase (GGDEF)-like protein/PAS domain S-box-containing protein
MSGATVTEEKWLSFKTGGQRALMAVSKTPMRSADGHVVGVLGIARDITDIKRHEYMMAANNTALAQIARGVPLADTLTQIARNIESQNPDLLVSIMLLDESGRHLHTGAAPSLPASFNAALDDITIGSKVGSCGTAAYLHAPVFVEDIETSPLWDDWRGLAREYGLRACWSTPIDSSAGVLLGTFAIYCRQPRRAVAADIRLIEMATSIAAVAIEHSSVELRRTMIADKLRDHEARLALALEGSETGVWDRDLEKRFVNYSAGWKALFGYGPDDIPSRNVDSVGRLHPDDLPHVKAAFQSHLKGLTDLYTAEHRVLCKDGSYKWVISRGKVVDRAPDGTALRMIGTTTDITDMRALTEKLRQGHDLITNLTNEVPGLVYQYKLRTDGTSYFPYASEGIRSIYEVAPEHVARDASAIHKLIHPDDYAAFVDSLRVSAECLKPWHLEYRVILPVQGLAWRLGNAQPRQLMDGSILWHGFITDISERKALEKAILENEEKYRTVTENSPDAIIRYDREVRRIYVNKVYEKISGIPLADLLGQRPNDISVLGQDAAVSLVEKLQDVIVHGLESDMEVKFVRDGDAFIFHLRAIPEFDAKGNVTSVLTFSRDITERKRMEAELQQLATTDYLTGLPNRRHFMSKLTEELARIQRLGVPRTSVLMIDIDHFKNINDSHGHATGDLVLKHFADVARRALRRIDTVGRVGGEEFAFILPGADVHEAEIFAERFREKIEHSHVTHEALEIAFTVSIGISAIDPEDANADAILNRTDKALYRAKTSGRNRVEIAVEPN